MKPVIVIGRSFGAGGRALGKELSRIMGFDYYDNEILKETAVKHGFSDEIFFKADERRPSLFKRLTTACYGVQEAFSPDTLSAESLYEAQSKVIRGVAEKGNCVIVGRSADYILRDHPGLVSIFLHAPVEYRANKIMQRGDAPDLKSAVSLARKCDREREQFYNYFTGRKWGHADNYHYTFDASRLPIDKTAALLRDIIGIQNENF